MNCNEQVLRTYESMNQVYKAFAATDSALKLVIVIGDPGLGKSTFQKTLEDAFVAESIATAFGLYTDIYEHRNAPMIVLDDVDALLSTPAGIALLKALGQSQERKTLSWRTAAADRANIPRSFETSARVLIFLNEIKGNGKNFMAVLDRAHVFRFSPTPEEVHREVGFWIDGKHEDCEVDMDVFQFIGDRLKLITTPSFRDYKKASEQKIMGLDWQTWLLNKWNSDPKLAAAAEILRMAEKGDPRVKTSEQRVELFRSWGHGTRSTFMEYQRKVQDLFGWKKIARTRKERNRLTGSVLPEDMVDIFMEEKGHFNETEIEEECIYSGEAVSKSESPMISGIPV